MKTTGRRSILISGVIVLLILSGQAQARFKCWTNNEGIRECGETVPPEFAQKGHQEMSKQGAVLEKKERAKTEAELAEEARLAVIAAEQQKIEDEKAKQDKILLDTFTSVAELETARDDKLAVIESSITLQAAATAERAGNAPNEALLNDINLLRARIDKNKVFIKGKEKEKEAVPTNAMRKFRKIWTNALKAAANLDIERYKRLKNL